MKSIDHCPVFVDFRDDRSNGVTIELQDVLGVEAKEPARLVAKF